ncbi:hypothetical protein DD80_23670 [Salmonella enterica subsp. enterica serovar Agona]|nr:hypothetical protein DD80_23670 [Salmonella enterica subsp. enterica serovar Agona]
MRAFTRYGNRGGGMGKANRFRQRRLLQYRGDKGAVKRISGGNGIDSLNAKSRNAAALAVYAGPDATELW